MTSDEILNQLHDGMQCQLLKGILKASRLAAAEKLAHHQKLLQPASLDRFDVVR
jgi:hypothetical protein